MTKILAVGDESVEELDEAGGGDVVALDLEGLETGVVLNECCQLVGALVADKSVVDYHPRLVPKWLE